MSVLAVIPARYGSARVPGKPLCDLGGLPLVEHVRRRILGAADRVVVASDDPRVVDSVTAFGGEALLTPPCGCGTERTAWVAARIEAEIVVNVQGDQPLVHDSQVSEAISLVEEGAPIGTIARPLGSREDGRDEHLVKVVLDEADHALYFSRSAVPHGGPYLVHVGIYAFRKEILAAVSSLPETGLERSERLEQLRWLAAGFPIRVRVVDAAECAVDTPDQLTSLQRRFESGELTPPP